ncbi:MAG: hypothetical protein EOM67_08425 [Spirochaetia bacterium]|nr:hypothetical protein [Spirochaetia bacterium]
MNDYSLTAFPMIVFSLIASMYLFNGAFFRFRTHIALFFSAFIMIAIIFIAFNQQKIVFAFSLLFSSITQFSFLTTLLIFFLSIGGVFIVVKWVLLIAPYIIMITCSLVCSLMMGEFIFGVDNLYVILFIWALCLIVAIVLYRMRRQELLIVSSALIGSYVLSSLFASLYYFSLPVHITLFIGLLGGGLLVQLHTNKQLLNKRNDG